MVGLRFVSSYLLTAVFLAILTSCGFTKPTARIQNEADLFIQKHATNFLNDTLLQSFSYKPRTGFYHSCDSNSYKINLTKGNSNLRLRVNCATPYWNFISFTGKSDSIPRSSVYYSADAKGERVHISTDTYFCQDSIYLKQLLIRMVQNYDSVLARLETYGISSYWIHCSRSYVQINFHYPYYLYFFIDEDSESFFERRRHKIIKTYPEGWILAKRRKSDS